MKFHQAAKFFEKFNVKSDLMGLAIGAHGSNIMKARKVPGIVSIEIEDDTCTFKVAGDVSYLLSFIDLNIIEELILDGKSY